jgi:4a-hydroxytetrahydrobiopterin dehydratase
MKLTDNEIAERLPSLPDWKLHDNALQREFRFRDFAEAFAFMTKVARVAERMNHHPDWSNAYNRVSIRVTTHDVGGVSEKDFELAAEIDKLL